MSSSLNRAMLIGHLGQDPEIRATQSGGSVATLSLATSERWTDKASGEKRERTEWHRVVIFNENLAEIAEKYLKKGSKVYVEGQLATRKWQDRDGHDRHTTEIVLQRFGGNLLLLDRAERPPPPGDDSYGTTRPAGERRQSPATTGGSFAQDLDDDIPF